MQKEANLLTQGLSKARAMMSAGAGAASNAGKDAIKAVGSNPQVQSSVEHIKRHPYIYGGGAATAGLTGANYGLSQNNESLRSQILSQQSLQSALQDRDPGTSSGFMSSDVGKAALGIGVPSLALLLLAGALS